MNCWVSWTPDKLHGSLHPPPKKDPSIALGTPSVTVVGTPPPLLSKRGGRGLTGPQLLQVGCWERGGDFFQGVAIFT